LLLADMLMNRQERLDHAEELMIFTQKVPDLIAELSADRSGEEQPAFLDLAADLVLDIPAHGHKPSSRDEYRADPLAFFAFNFDFSIPTDPHQFGETSRVVLIALVHAHRQGGVCMPRINTNHGKPNPTKFVPKPARHRTGLKTNALRQ
jgi:hypothetical protein